MSLHRRWTVRLAIGSPAEREMEPFVVHSHEELAQVLSGLLAAIALTAGDEHIALSVDSYETDGDRA